jgi:L,D-peptidoglycan transpeptidase YkuD (ErfK/YbiS/YcfS/YnhG family)
MGRGRGLHDRDVALRIGPEKKEGDRRAPAGLFGLGTSFGPSDGPWRWPFRKTEPEDRVVDDPLSPDYNTWQRAPGRWASAERMADYRLGLVVDHNRGPIEPGAGSAIFLHTGDPTVGTLGCTVMSEPNLRKVLAWLQPDRRPVLLQVPGHLY